MTNIKVPSLQHLAKMSRGDAMSVKRALQSLASNSPTFSYALVYELVRDLLVLKIPYEQVVGAVTTKISRQDVRENFLSLLPLIRDHFSEISVDFVSAVSSRFYPVGRGLMVPFHPPLIYGSGGQIHFPWFSFWRSKPLSGEQLSLFVTIVEEVLFQDSDLEEAKFSILDFSAPAPGFPRELKILDAAEISRLPPARKVEMLEAFADGYHLAKSEPQADSKNNRKGIDESDADQIDLFD